MATVGRLAVVLSASATDFERVMGKAARSVRTTEREFMRSARQMESIGRRWSLGVTAPIMAVMGAITKTAVEFKAFKQESSQAFSVLIGSAEMAKKHLDDILDFARTTPFAFPDLISAYRTLSAFGMELEKTHPVMEAIANSVAAMGGGAQEIGEMADVFARIQSQGKVTARELNRLGAKGINAVGIMANKAGVSMEDMRKMISRGAISSKRAIDWLVDGIMNGTKGIAGETVAMAGSLGALKKTWKGAIDTLKASWRNLTDAIISDKMFEQLIAGVHKLTDKIKKLQQAAEAFGQLPAPIQKAVWSLVLLVAAIGPAFMLFSLLNKAIAAGIGVYGKFAGLLSSLAFTFEALRTGAAKTLGEALVYLAGGPIKLTIIAIGAAIVAAILLAANWEKVKAWGIAAWNAISAVVLYAASLIVRGIGLIISAIGFIIPAVRGAGQSLIGLANNLKASAGAALSTARSTVVAVKAASDAAKAQDNIAKSGQDAVGAQEDLEKAMKSAGKAAAKTLMPFDEIHAMQADLSKSPAAGAGFDDMLDFADIVAPEIPDIAVPGIGGIADVAAGVGDTLSKAAEVAGSAWDRLKEKMGPVNKAVQWIKDNWPTIGPIIENIASIIMVLLVPALIKSGIEAMIAAGKHVLAWTIKGGAALLHGGKIVGQLLLMIVKWAWAGVMALVHAAKVVLAWAMQGLAAVVQGAVMIGTFILIIAKWAWAAAMSLLHAGQMAAAWFIALGPVAWVIATVIALAALIIANWDWVKEKTAIAWAAITDFFSNAWTNIKNVFSWANIKAFFSGAWDAIKSIFSGIPDWFRDKFNDAWTRVKNVFSAGGSIFSGIKEGIADTFRGIVNNLITGINTIIRIPFNKINSMLNTIRDISVLGVSPFKNLWSYNPLAVPQIPKLARGTSYVPEDTLAYLHKGEAVVPRKYNPVAAGGSAAGAGGGAGGRFGAFGNIGGADMDLFAKKIAAALKGAGVAMGATSDDTPLIIQINLGSSRILDELITASQRKNARAGKTVITVGV